MHGTSSRRKKTSHDISKRLRSCPGMRHTSANRRRRRHWPPDTMPRRRCREFVDSRLRRSPPDRASAVPYGQAGENASRFPHLAHRSAAAHKLHSTPQQDGMNLISGNDQTSSRLPALAYSSPEAVQTTGTVAVQAKLAAANQVGAARAAGCVGSESPISYSCFTGHSAE